jgi:hypothetical protein
MTEKQTNEVKENIFFSMKSGIKKQVTREVWEKEWLDWWNKTNSFKDSKEDS